MCDYSEFRNDPTSCERRNLKFQKSEFNLGTNRNQLGRLRDDSCELDNIYKESIGPGNYKMSGSQQVNNNTYMEHSTINLSNLENRGINPCCVDVESELHNLPRAASKCPKHKQPNNNIKDCQKYNIPRKQIIPESTRMNKSCDTTSGRSVLGYYFNNLCEQPQELKRIHSNDIIGRNSRLCYKDDYKNKFDFKSRGVPTEQNLVTSNACCRNGKKSSSSPIGAINSKSNIGSKHEEYAKNLKNFKSKLDCSIKHTL